ncbi:MAG: hypothetical protein RH862_08815 [Leptospiraceae bacterium]
MSIVSLALLILVSPAGAQPDSDLEQEDWRIVARGQPLKMPGYDLFSVKVVNESDQDRSLLGLIHLAGRSDSGNPKTTAKCQFFASVPAGKSVEIQVPCKWESEKGKQADSIEIEIEKTYPFLLESEDDQ